MRLSKNTIIVFFSWLILALAIIYINFIQGVRPAPLKKSFIYFPFEIGEWRDKEKTGSDYLITALGADDILIREYEDREGEKLELYFSYFQFTKKGGPHAPQLCWVGSGWSFQDLGEERLTLDCKNCPQVVLKKILASKEDKKILLFYCYRINKKYFSDFFKFRAASVFNSIVKRRNNSFTLQLSMQLDGKDLEKEESKMREFLLKVFSVLETDFLP